MSVDAMSDIFLEAMKQDETAHFSEGLYGNIIKGEVVAVNSGDVFLNLGGKSECIVPLSEFSQLPSIGDSIEVTIKEMREGVNIASKLEADKIKRSKEIRNAFNEELPISGKIEKVVYKESIPKGFMVNLGIDTMAFLPLSQIDVKKNEKLENLEGLTTDFLITEMKRNNITVSRKEFLKTATKKLYAEFFDKHKVDDVVNAKVERVEKDFAVLVSEGVRLFMHISDFSWKFLDDMQKVLKIGDEMTVKILKMEKSKNSIKVGKKQLTSDPWSSVDKKYNTGDVIKGKVISYKKDGVLIEVEDGVEAFLPVAEMSWTEKIREPKKFLKIGTIVEVKIKSIEVEKRRMGVSLRDIQENPWENAEQKYPYGRKVEGVITSILDFGLFVKFDDGIEGLMRREDVDWLDSSVDLKKKFHKGEKIQAIVLSVDKEREKIRLGYKQLSDNPYKTFSLNYPKGSVVSAIVKQILEDRAIVSLEGNLEGFIHISQISKDKVENIKDVLKIGEEVKAIVKYVDLNKNKIEISIRDYLMNEEKIEVAKYIASEKTVASTMKLGSLLKDKTVSLNSGE